MKSETVDIIVTIFVKLVIPLVAIYLVPMAAKLFAKWNREIEGKIGKNNYTMAMMFAHNAVEAAEQALGIQTGAQKKALAKYLIEQFCREANIPITEDQIETLIESAVGQLNGEPRYQARKILYKDSTEFPDWVQDRMMVASIPELESTEEGDGV